GRDPDPSAVLVRSLLAVVLVVFLGRLDHAPLADRFARRQPPVVAGCERARGGEDHSATPRAKHAEPEQLVALLQQEVVRGGAEPVAPAAGWPPGGVLGGGEQERAVCA